jgi:hypothetical protein
VASPFFDGWMMMRARSPAAGLTYPFDPPRTTTSPSGTEASVAALTRDDLVAFHRDWLRPDNATLIVTGDTTAARVLPVLEKHFGDWQAAGTPRPSKALPEAATPSAPRVFLVDKPGAVQSNILVGQVLASSSAPNRLETDTMNNVLGGTFTSRINMNLREDKHWSYGARSSLPDALGGRPWLLSAPVQTDKTVESMREIQREIAEFVGNRPASGEGVQRHFGIVQGSVWADLREQSARELVALDLDGSALRALMKRAMAAAGVSLAELRPARGSDPVGGFLGGLTRVRAALEPPETVEILVESIGDTPLIRVPFAREATLP